MFLFLLGPSLPSWINAVSVVVLAIVTFFYARSAKRQADAGESQAKAATKQAEAAERQLAVLQSQIEEQAGIALAALKQSVAELEQSARHWQERYTRWGQIGTREAGADLLPGEWAVLLERARRLSPELHREALALQELSRRVSLKMDQFAATDHIYRSPTMADEITALLGQIVSTCEAVSERLGSLS